MAARSDAAAAPRPPLADRLTRVHWLVIDCVVALLLAGTMLFGGPLLRGLHGAAPVPAMALLALVITLPVAVRRIWPLPVFAVVTAASAAMTVLGRAPATMDLALALVTYMAAVRSRRPVALAVLGLSVLSLGAAVLTVDAGSRLLVLGLHSLLVAVTFWFIGDSVRERRRYLEGLAEQEARRRRAEAGQASQAIREERVRIARELHDVVAHTLSVVTVQAGVGRRLGAARPAEALQALRSVEETGRGALEELRRILGLLRDDTEEPSLAPAPGLADLAELADTVRAAGVPVRLAVTGDAGALPPAAALTVYRIVQEALTNVVRHAGAAEASVQVRVGPDGAHVTVTDTGTNPATHTGTRAQRAGATPPAATRVPPDRAGPPGLAGQHGIVGMHERAAVFGGHLDAGPRPGGGFQVTAFLPVAGLAVGQVA